MRTIGIAILTLGIFAVAVAVQNAPKPMVDDAKKAPADASPKYVKGNLHTHSLWSDGDDFPEMIADWYKSHGYQFLAMTEHNTLAEGDRWIAADGKEPRPQAVAKYRDRFGDRWVERKAAKEKPLVRLKPQSEYRTLFDEPGKFLIVPAEEITHKYAKAPVHINAINVRDVFKPIDGGSVEETISVNMRQVADRRAKTGQKVLAILNHPNFGWGVRAEEMILAEGLRFFEVFNGHPGVRNYGDADHVSCEMMWDIVNTLRIGKHDLPIVYGMATDDAHYYHSYGVGKVNPGRGWVMVKTSHLTSETIVNALEAGDFYSTSGVLLEDIAKVESEYRLTIKQEPGITYSTEFIATMKSASIESIARKDKDGNELPVTRLYSEQIGKVVARSTESKPAYKFTGQELYVRAKVTSSKPHPNPYAAGDREVAWTQPVRP